MHAQQTRQMACLLQVLIERLAVDEQELRKIEADLQYLTNLIQGATNGSD